ncbi:uncharacterized protein LOC119694152 [Plutella xylostella]|uniref:uncharacterized protein LOC119694152 n=1 Tax=Plutella xylostella TaxID=51655 RepID=UPI002032790A|nr:uncharacterized protein LOC119694152 [Plutella xylostella]
MSSSIKSQLGSISNIVKAYENYKKAPKDRLAKESYLQTRLEALEFHFKIVTDNHTKLLSEASDEILDSHEYFTTDMYSEVEETYIMYKADLKEALSRFMPSASAASEQTNKHVTTKGETQVHLPKISIPVFSGSYSEWIPFRDLFTSLIHNNESLDSVQKMHYLKGYLSGEAEQLLRYVAITASAYQESWALLNSRYNNKKYLVNCLMKRFMNQPSVANETSSAIKDMLDLVNETVNGLKNLGVPTDSWDVFIIYVVCSRLDPESRKGWEVKISTSDELPTLNELREYLTSRFRSLEFLDTKFKPKQSKVMHTMSDGNNEANVICAYCDQGGHKISNCQKFCNTDYRTRNEFVQTNGLCFNCLGRNHSVNICRSYNKCRICKHKHHSLLHPTTASGPQASGSKSHIAVEVNSTGVDEVVDKNSFDNPATPSKVSTHFSKKIASNQVLLATALVNVKTRSGQVHLLRALLDQGSQASFITESAVQLLGLRKMPTRSSISGVGSEKSTLSSKYMVETQIQSRHDPGFQVQVRAHVLSAITSLLPSDKVGRLDWLESMEIPLADPQYHTPNKIDILLGADVYGQVLTAGLMKSPRGSPIAQNTALGWILSGPTHQESDDDKQASKHCYHNVIISMHSQVDDNDMLKKFWEIESDTCDTKILSLEEQLCEEFYEKTTQRDSTGRYIVRLPFRNDDPQCKHGRSRDIALRRFHLLEQRFKKNQEFKARYSAVIQEYLDLGHMERVADDDLNNDSAYLPHHAVIREDKTTSKVRVVFDGSCKGVNGVSLNSELMIGPRLQQDLRHIVIRWRMHPICLCADIVKMYRQVIVADKDADYQRIVWRDDPDSEIRDYKLVRVTFGTASAPYLAVKTVQQLATDDGSQFPIEVVKGAKSDFYVDDLLTGCQTVEEGTRMFKEYSKLLRQGGFDLQKWVTNNKELAEIMTGKPEIQDRKVEIRTDEVVKILGLAWNKDIDAFEYTVQLPDNTGPVTKRKVISSISRLFDPLGWAAPCIIVAKVTIQKLWLAGIDWDEELPEELLNEWLSYQRNLIDITKLIIPRWVGARNNDVHMELQGFCDASNIAYAAVVYLRIIDSDGNIHINLVTAKTKVAPTMQVSIPRLELMGAVLLSRLITEVGRVLGINHANIHGWTDSTVVLAWLSSHPSRWSTFIGNRTSDILSRLESTQWSHVQSAQNPADIASRGCSPGELAENPMWIQGPSWLKDQSINYQRPKSISTNLEERHIKAHVTVDETKTFSDTSFWEKYSSLHKLVRIVAVCRRFLVYKRSHKFGSHLTKSEINDALDVCIRQSQLICDMEKLKSLCPFLDDKGIMRVGGRLQNASLDHDAKHPIILPHKSHFTNLVVDDAHKRTLHGGPTLMLNHLRTKYWIVAAKKLVKAHVHNCVKCVRHAAATKTQYMGQLPESRVTPSRPFLHSGVDFAGPINVRMSKGRGNKSYKGYICVFICMATKAIHLEAISDLTAEGFIAGFKRLVARRGHVSDVWSDNGTNFVGASRELHKLVSAENSSVAVEIQEWLSDNSVTWHFIPPHAPNFGGLWEAGVKSTKFHLRRVIGDSTLTYEELATTLAQIEACLNSRPLSILSDDHQDPTPLTPGHFLVGEPLVIVPERNYELCNIASLKRWQLTQRMVQNFWRRWSNEYLVYCMQRYKWSKVIPEPKLGDIVLIKEDNLPPARWLLGRVVAKHPGSDQLTRVVTLKCNGSLIKRPTSKLCILPIAS